MAAEQNLGSWAGRSVSPGSEPIPLGDEAATVSTTGSSILGDGEGEGERGDTTVERVDASDLGSRPSRDASFWLTVLIGLLPVLMLVAGFVGYWLGGRNADDDQAAAGMVVTADGAESSDGPSDDLAVEATLPVETTPPIETTPAAPADRSSPDREPVASGVVADGTIELVGLVPVARRSLWGAEIADLASMLGFEVIDRMEPADVAPDSGSAELTVSFPGAVAFAEGSPAAFDGDPHAVFGSTAGFLNRGTAHLTIVAYAETGDQAADSLALGRAGHVREHLLDLGVDPNRIDIEARPPADAPAGGAGAGPVDARIDLEFRYQT